MCVCVCVCVCVEFLCVTFVSLEFVCTYVEFVL